MNERIKAARKALGLTMEQFGKRVGLSKSAISLIESGKNGTTEQTVASICRELVSMECGCALAKARCSTRAQNLLLTVWPPSIIWMSGKKPSSPLSSSSALPIRRLSFATSILWPQSCLSRPRRWTSMPKLKPIVRNFLRRKKRRSLSLPPLVQPPTRAEISQKGSCASLHKSLLRCQCNETNFMANFW